MRIERGKYNGIVGGVVLVVIGILAFLDTLNVQWLKWDAMWPVFPALVGVLLIVRSLGEDTVHRAETLSWGSLLVLLAGFFYLTTTGIFTWEQQDELWPFYLIIIGAANLIAYLVSGLSLVRYLVSAAVFSVLGAIFLPLTLSGLLSNGEWWASTFPWLDGIFAGWGDTWWPLAVIGMGLIFYLAAVLTRSPGARSAFVIAGTIPFLTGIFFLATTLGLIRWEDQGRLWPLYPLIVAVAFIGAYLASAKEHTIFLWLGGIVGTVGLVFLVLALTDFRVMSDVWPLVLILAGLALLVPTLRPPRAHGHR